MRKDPFRALIQIVPVEYLDASFQIYGKFTWNLKKKKNFADQASVKLFVLK